LFEFQINKEKLFSVEIPTIFEDIYALKFLCYLSEIQVDLRGMFFHLFAHTEVEDRVLVVFGGV
jgi:hypothetical protein